MKNLNAKLRISNVLMFSLFCSPHFTLSHAFMYPNCNKKLQTMIKEEDCLASVIAELDDDVKIVPRGAYVQVPTAEVVKNRMFEGNVSLLLCILYVTNISIIYHLLISGSFTRGGS